MIPISLTTIGTFILQELESYAPKLLIVNHMYLLSFCFSDFCTYIALQYLFSNVDFAILVFIISRLKILYIETFLIIKIYSLIFISSFYVILMTNNVQMLLESAYYYWISAISIIILPMVNLLKYIKVI